MSFEDWMEALDRLIYNATGVSIYHLPDMLFRDAYDDNTTPEEFAIEKLGYNGDGSFNYEVLNDLLRIRSAGVNGQHI